MRRPRSIFLPPLADQWKILAALEALDEQAAAIECRLGAARAAWTVLSRHRTDGTVVLTRKKVQRGAAGLRI
jgi:hypothetical protein